MMPIGHLTGRCFSATQLSTRLTFAGAISKLGTGAGTRKAQIPNLG